MATNRRSFLKKAAITAPGVALLGTGMSGNDSIIIPETINENLKKDYGWLDVRDCGASGSTFRTAAVTKSGQSR